MNDDNKTTDAPGDFGALVGKNIGSLVILGILQARAMMDLASAINNDEHVSPATREAASKCLSRVDEMILQIEELASGTDIKGYFQNG